jgi:hypothetical protein
MSEVGDTSLDANKIASEVVSGLTKEFLNEVRQGAASFFRRNVTLRLETFSEYIDKTRARCSSVRLIIDKDRLYDLGEIYVGTKYSCGEEIVTDLDLSQYARDNKRIVVQGFGGIGKTMFMKYLWMSIFNNPEGRIPVFIELKRLNDISDIHIDSYLRLTLSSGDNQFSDDDFRTLCRDGRFIFLFDAFDEIRDDKRMDAERALLSFSSDYPRCGFVVSSRKDNRFSSWETFESYTAEAFDRGQIKEVINSVEFDRVVKKRFLAEIIDKKEKFEEYSDFLSTPLLALMMLLMYRQFADVPEKIHLFYRYAFQTLYSLHDGNKESFTRHRKTNLDEDQFCKVFSIFSLMSYGQMISSYKIEHLRSIISAAITRSNVNVSVDDFINEAIESVNLLYKEGEVVSFVHRSFQEYFSAFAIVNFFSDKMADVFMKLPEQADDKVYMMSYEMNPDVVEDYFLVPQYAVHKEAFDGIVERSGAIDGMLAEIHGRWLVFAGGAPKAPNILQETLFIGGGPMKFASIAARCVDPTGYSKIEENKTEISPELTSFCRYLYAMAQRKSTRKTNSKIVIVDFKGRMATYDDDDGMRVLLSEDEFSEVEKRAYKCKTYLRDKLSLWQRKVVFVRNVMARVHENTRAREDKVDFLTRL